MPGKKNKLQIVKLLIIILVTYFLFPPNLNVEALNKINNWNFSGSSTGWTATNNGSGINGCGSSTSTTRTAMATFAYDNANGNPSGSFNAVSGTGNGSRYKAYIRQQVAAPGSGTIKAKGKFDYYGSSTSWRASNTDGYIRVDLFDSGNTNYVANLVCQQLPGSNVSWTTVNFGSDVDLTGGTTYTVRVTIAYRNNGTTAATLKVDNIDVNFAPSGLSVSTEAATTNSTLNWTASSAGSGANGLNTTTPYKIYRDTASPVTTFLANAASNSFTDSTTQGNTTYFFAVSDLDTASDESPKSSEVSILTLPGSPGTPTFTNIKESTLTVNWSSPSGGASSYKIDRCSGDGCSNFSEIRSGETGTSYNDSGLSGNTTYRYRIRATNQTGDGAYSEIGEVITSIVSISITSDGSIAYGYITAGGTKSTIDLSDTQTAQNNGNVTENFNIKSSNASEGTQWTIGTNPGPDIFVHEFSTNEGSSWTKFNLADSYYPLATGISVSGTQNFDLRLTAPTSSSDYQQKTITITVQAVSQ